MSGTRIEERRRVVEQLLENMPANLVEARRYITRETSREPEPQILQCMVKIAGDEAISGPRHEIPLSLLTLRSVADDQLSRFNGDGTTHPEGIREAAGILRSLEKHLILIEQDLATLLPVMEENDKKYLIGIHKRLIPSRERLLTAQVLSRFFELPERPELPQNCSVEERDGTILLHLIGVDLTAWLETPVAADGASSEREGLWTRLNDYRVAYKRISSNVAASKDTSFIAGRKREYEALNQLQRDLFSAYTRLTKVLIAARAAAAGTAAADTASSTNLQANIDEAEQAAAALNEANEQRREVMDDALRGVRESRVAPPKLRNYLNEEHRDGKQRVRILYTVCGVLAVAAVVVNLMLFAPRGADVEMIPEEFSDAMPLTQATKAADLMLAETDSELWNVWNLEERQEHVRSLTRQADVKGFTSLLLSDETGRQLVFWQQGSKPQLF